MFKSLIIVRRVTLNFLDSSDAFIVTFNVTSKSLLGVRQCNISRCLLDSSRVLFKVTFIVTLFLVISFFIAELKDSGEGGVYVGEEGY